MASKLPHPLDQDDDQLKKACSIVRTRRGGPGGQHRNKVDTAIVITHDPTGVSAQAGEERSQHANLKVALTRLKINLAIAVRTASPSSSDRQVSQLFRSRVKGGRISVSVSHEDFPRIITEALDALADCENDLVTAAESLGLSTSQLVKLLKANPQVLDHVQRQRQSQNLGRLK